MCTDSLQQSGKGAHKNVLKKKKKTTNMEKEKKNYLTFLFASLEANGMYEK